MFESDMKCMSVESIGQIGINADLMKDIEAVIFNIMLGLNSPEDGGSKPLRNVRNYLTIDKASCP